MGRSTAARSPRGVPGDQGHVGMRFTSAASISSTANALWDASMARAWLLSSEEVEAGVRNLFPPRNLRQGLGLSLHQTPGAPPTVGRGR